MMMRIHKYHFILQNQLIIPFLYKMSVNSRVSLTDMADVSLLISVLMFIFLFFQ